jgi:hypothetical protein
MPERKSLSEPILDPDTAAGWVEGAALNSSEAADRGTLTDYAEQLHAALEEYLGSKLVIYANSVMTRIGRTLQEVNQLRGSAMWVDGVFKGVKLASLPDNVRNMRGRKAGITNKNYHICLILDHDNGVGSHFELLVPVERQVFTTDRPGDEKRLFAIRRGIDW